MFDVHNGKLYFDNHPVGTIGGAPWLGLEIAAIDAIKDWKDTSDMFTDEEHQKALNQCEKDAYECGHKDGEEAGRAACEAENRDEWEAAARAEGRDSALEDADRAAQTHLVDALLLALAKAHNDLQTVTNKRYPAAKISECKAAMQRAQSTLRIAIGAYKADPTA